MTSLSGKNLGLPVQRQVIVVFGHDDVSQQPGAGPAAGNRMVGGWRGDNDVAGPARQLLTDVPDHLEPAGHVIERLGDVLADAAQRTAAARTDARGGVRHVLAREMIRQCAPGRLLPLGGAFDRVGNNRRGGGEPLGLVLFECLDSQLELLDLARQLLRGATELGAPVASQLELQPGDLGLGGNGVLRHHRDDLLQRLRVIGKLIERDRHSFIESRRHDIGVIKRSADSLCRTHPATSGRQVRCGIRSR